MIAASMEARVVIRFCRALVAIDSVPSRAASGVPAAEAWDLIVHLARALDPVAEIDMRQAERPGRGGYGRGS